MLDGAARLDELVAKAVADGQPALGITDHGNMYGTLEFYKECREQGVKPIIGTEAYMAHDHRSERPTRRGRIDDSGGDTEGGKKLYYHLTLLAENDAGLPQPDPARQQGLPRGLLLQAAARLGAARRAPRRAHRHHRLPRRPRAAVAAAGRRAGRAREGRRGCRTSSARDNLFVELQDHGLPAQRETNPQLIEIAAQLRRAAARHQRLALHPPRGPRGPRRPAVRADRRRAVGPQALQVRGPRALPEDRRRDALPVPRGPRGVRQHAVGRRAGRRRDRVRRAAAARTSRCPRASPTTPTTSPTSRGRAPASAGATTLPEPRRAAHPVRARRHRRRWGSARTSSSCGTSSATPATRGIRVGPGPRLGRRLRRRLLPAHHRPRPDPATTCCSSASSTRAASRCPTSTWTSTPATGTR